MNKILLALISMMSLNLLQASGHEFDWSNPRLISGFIDKDLMTRNERRELDVKRPMDKAIFEAIRRGADEDFINSFLSRSRRTSGSPEFNSYMRAEVNAAYRSYSPTVLDLKHKINTCFDGAHRVDFEEELERYKKFYK